MTFPLGIKKYKWILVFLLGLVLGGLLNAAWDDYYGSNNENRGKIIREGNYKLINPILACEIGTKDIFKELRPIEQKLEAAIKSYISIKKAKNISLYFRLMNTGRWLGVNEDEKFAPASLMKVLVMIAYFKQAESNPYLLSKNITYQKRDPIESSSTKLVLTRTYTVNDLINLMIKDSDNASLYLLIDNLPLHSLREAFDDLNIPLPESQDEKDLAIMSPKIYSLVFRVLYGATYLNREYSEKALELLSQTKFHGGLVAKLSTDAVAAHKFGSSSITEGAEKLKELHDCGIIYFPDHPYLLCMMTKSEKIEDSEQVIADLSLLTYQEVTKFFDNLNLKRVAANSR